MAFNQQSRDSCTNTRHRPQQPSQATCCSERKVATREGCLEACEEARRCHTRTYTHTHRHTLTDRHTPPPLRKRPMKPRAMRTAYQEPQQAPSGLEELNLVHGAMEMAFPPLARRSGGSPYMLLGPIISGRPGLPSDGLQSEGGSTAISYLADGAVDAETSGVGDPRRTRRGGPYTVISSPSDLGTTSSTAVLLYCAASTE